MKPPPTPKALPLPHPTPATQPHTHGKVDAAKQRMETKPRPTLASSQPSWAHSPNTSQIHWIEPLGQMEKLLAPTVLQTMAAEGGSLQARGSKASKGLFYTKGKRGLQPWGGLAPGHSPVTGSYWSCPLHSGDKRPDFIQLLCQLNEFVCGVGGPIGQQHPLMQLVNI